MAKNEMCYFLTRTCYFMQFCPSGIPCGSLFSNASQKMPKSATRSARRAKCHLKKVLRIFFCIRQGHLKKKIFIRKKSLFYWLNKHVKVTHPAADEDKLFLFFSNLSNQSPAGINGIGMVNISALGHILHCLFWLFRTNSGQTTLVTPNLTLLAESSMYGV